MQSGKSIGLSALALAIGAVATQAQADIIVKANNTDNLNLGSSWVSGTAPGSSDIALWNSTAVGTNTTVLGANLSWQGIKIANPGGIVTINAGNTLTLGASGIDMSTATRNMTINAPIILGASQAWNGGAQTLTASSTVNLGDYILTVNGTTGVGTVSGTGTIRTLGGTTSFAGASSFGALTVDGGTVSIGTYAITTAGAISISGAGSRLSLGNRATFTANSLSISNGGDLYTNGIGGSNSVLTIGAGGLQITQTASGVYTPIMLRNGSATRYLRMHLNGNLTFTGDAGNTNSTFITYNNDLVSDEDGGSTANAAIVLKDARTFDIGNGGADVDVVNDVRIINGVTAGALIKTGAGTLALNGKNTYTGGTTVSAGRLLINNSTAGNVAVNGGTLGGTGSIAGTVTVADNATLTPGASAGTLTVGALSLAADSNLAFELGSLAGPNDLIQVNGNLTLDGKLAVAALTGFGEGTYTLMTYTGDLTNNGLSVFSMPAGTSGTIAIDTTNKAVNLVVVVPEPAGLALLGVAAAGMLARRRRVA